MIAELRGVSGDRLLTLPPDPVRIAVLLPALPGGGGQRTRLVCDRRVIPSDPEMPMRRFGHGRGRLLAAAVVIRLGRRRDRSG